MGVDSTKVVASDAVGRDSVRIESTKKWLHHVSMYVNHGLKTNRANHCQFLKLQCSTHAPRLRVSASITSLTNPNICQTRTWPAIWEVGQSWEDDGEVS